MATYRSGAGSRVVIGKESAFNTAGTVGHILRKSEFSFDGIVERIENDELRADPNPAADETGMQVCNGQLVAPVTVDEFGLLCYFFLGDYAVSGAGPYEHIFKIDTSAIDSVWIEVGDTSLTKFDLFEGLAITGISLGTIVKGQSQMLKATVDFQCSGKYTLNGGAAQDASPDSYTNRIHTQPSVELKIDSSTTALIQETTYSVMRTIAMSGVLDTNLFHSDQDQQKYRYDITIRGWRDSADTILGYDDAAEHTYEIVTGQPGAPATRNISILHSEAFIFNSEGGGGVRDDGPVFSSARVAPFYADHADGSSIVVTVNGDVADYSAAV